VEDKTKKTEQKEELDNVDFSLFYNLSKAKSKENSLHFNKTSEL
jgi:hypothetical protein